MEEALNRIEPASTLDLDKEAKEAMTTLMAAMVPECSVYDVDFREHEIMHKGVPRQNIMERTGLVL